MFLVALSVCFCASFLLPLLSSLPPALFRPSFFPSLSSSLAVQLPTEVQRWGEVLQWVIYYIFQVNRCLVSWRNIRRPTKLFLEGKKSRFDSVSYTLSQQVHDDQALPPVPCLHLCYLPRAISCRPSCFPFVLSLHSSSCRFLLYVRPTPSPHVRQEEGSEGGGGGRMPRGARWRVLLFV